ncbi:MAG: hypothetical protein D6791_07045, partial [Chloroflexi bacterium]
PYLPHHIGLSIDIMSALRLQTGGVRHLGGSNRTIIKQAYEMLVNEHTCLADAPPGTLVTLDRVYELVAHNLSSEKQRDIDEIDKTFGAHTWEAKTARVLALIEQVQHLPRTPRNIAALLYERLGAELPLEAVEAALRRLEEAHFARQAEGGWKLLTVAEKTWEAERREMKVTLSQEMERLREALQRLWEDPGLRSMDYRSRRRFSFQVGFQGHAVTRHGDLDLHLVLADAPEALSGEVEEHRRETRAPSHRNEIHWVFPFTPALDNALQELARSSQMVNKYDQLDAQSMLGDEQRTNLQNEKRHRQRWEAEVDRRLREALLQGVGVFQGQTRAVSAFHAREWKDVVRGLVQWVVPVLYERLEEGSVSLPPRAPQQVLQAADLSRLPAVFYSGENALNLIVEGPDGYTLNTDAPVAAAILAYIRQEQDYGSSVTGRKLEEYFSAPPYGWSADLVRAVMALLLRSGQVEIVAQARRHNRPDDPAVRKVFEGVRDFRAATFRLRQQIDLRTLVRAARMLGDLLGQEISPEETVIYETAHAWAGEMTGEVRIAHTRARDAGLDAVLPPLEAFLHLVEDLSRAESEEVVRVLAEEGQDLKTALEGYQRVRPLLKDDALVAIRRARRIFGQFWPDVAEMVTDPGMTERVAQAQKALTAPDLPARLSTVVAAADEIADFYRQAYEDLHLRRGDVYRQALEEVKTWPAWEQLTPEEREQAVQPLLQRACATLDYDEPSGACRRCNAHIPSMRSDLRAVRGYLDEVRQALHAHLPAETKSPARVRLRLRDLAPATVLRTPEDVKALLEALHRALLEHLQQGEEVELE